jgi:FAD/FMN-containing dehydrogenase
MGGQQFGTDTLHLDTRSLNGVLAFDAVAGTIDVEAGIDWPTLIAATHRLHLNTSAGASARSRRAPTT